MGLKEILAAIRAESDRACEEITRKAEQDATIIIQDAENRAVELRQRELRLGEEAGLRERARVRYEARVGAGRRRTLAWDESYQATLEASRVALSTVRDRLDYPEILRCLIMESLGELDAPPVMLVDPIDEVLARVALVALREHPTGDHLPLPERVGATLSTWGGLEARTRDGQITVLNTLESRLERAEPSLRSLVAGIWSASEPSIPE